MNADKAAPGLGGPPPAPPLPFAPMKLEGLAMPGASTLSALQGRLCGFGAPALPGFGQKLKAKEEDEDDDLKECDLCKERFKSPITYHMASAHKACFP